MKQSWFASIASGDHLRGSTIHIEPPSRAMIRVESGADTALLCSVMRGSKGPILRRRAPIPSSDSPHVRKVRAEVLPVDTFRERRTSPRPVVAAEESCV